MYEKIYTGKMGMARLISRPKWGTAPLCRRLNAQVRQALEAGRRHMMGNGGVSMRANTKRAYRKMLLTLGPADGLKLLPATG